MSREQGPRVAGMRVAANAPGNRHEIAEMKPTFAEGEAA
jgi:hypothetical protein